MKRNKGYFSISAVAKMFSVHQQTIRLYEKEGLITPKRSEGNTRIFTEEDVDRLEEIIYLTHEVGINLAGVDAILKLQKRVKLLQGQINSLFATTNHDLDEDLLRHKRIIQGHIQRLAHLRQMGERSATQLKAHESKHESKEDEHVAE